MVLWSRIDLVAIHVYDSSNYHWINLFTIVCDRRVGIHHLK